MKSIFLFLISMIITCFYNAFTSLSNVNCVCLDCRSLSLIPLSQQSCYTSFGLLKTNWARFFLQAALIFKIFPFCGTLIKCLQYTGCCERQCVECRQDMEFLGFRNVSWHEALDLVWRKSLVLLAHRQFRLWCKKKVYIYCMRIWQRKSIKMWRKKRKVFSLKVSFQVNLSGLGGL